MRTHTAITVLAAAALLGTAPAASAKPAVIGGATVDRAGTAAVPLTNPNRHLLRGAVTIRSGSRVLATTRVRVAGRASRRAVLGLDRSTVRALRAGSVVRATASARLRRSGARATTVSRRVTLQMAAATTPATGTQPAAGSQPATGSPNTTTGGRPGTGTGGGQPSGAAPDDRWLATTSTGSQFALRIDGSALSLEAPVALAVSCAEMGGAYRVAASIEPFDLLGGWQLGEQDATREQSASRVNPLVNRSARPVRYRLASTRSGDSISGSITQSFFDSKYDVFSNTITYVNCAGTLNFSAVPHP